jgi:lipoprotein-releasing system permease protein
LKLEKFIAKRYLKSRQSTKTLSFISTISIIGITLGVATLIVVINVMAGFSENLKQKILGANSHIIINRYDAGPIRNWQSIEEKIKSVKEVTGVSPFVLNQVLLTSRKNAMGVLVRGVFPEKEKQVAAIKKYMKEGSYDSINGKNKIPNIVVGKELANQLGLGLGDEIVMVSPFGKKGPFGYTPTMKKFKIGGIFDTGMYEYNTSLAYVNLKVIQKFFKTGDMVSGFSIKVQDFNKAKIIADKIDKVIGFPYWARDWMSMNKNLFSALKLEKYTMAVILTLIIIVASFNVISLITMSVKDKRKDIAILRAMGASQKSIKKIFISQGMQIGLIGTIIGDIIAFIICIVLEKYKLISLPEDIYYLDRIPVKISPEVFVMVTIAALIITYLSSIFPASQAAKTDPIEALRNE